MGPLPGLRYLRMSRSMTQEELAQASGVSQGYVAALELGRGKDVSLRVARQLCEALDVTLSDLETPPPEGP